jgi:molybdate transport system substrate-binding protein
MTVVLLASSTGHTVERVVTVFAASSLTDVLEAVGKAFTATTRMPVRFSFAGSSALARQIESGAPADVLVSADQEWMDYLASRNLLRAGTRADVVSNSLVLIAPADTDVRLRISPGFALHSSLGKRGRIAMGDPASVPAGKYAKAALTHLGVWRSVENRLIPADNVRSALNFVALGEAPLGIVYATDAHDNSRVRIVDTFPASSHRRISYPVAATIHAGSGAAPFIAFLKGPIAQGIFKAAGFGPP